MDKWRWWIGKSGAGGLDQWGRWVGHSEADEWGAVGHFGMGGPGG